MFSSSKASLSDCCFSVRLRRATRKIFVVRANASKTGTCLSAGSLLNYTLSLVSEGLASILREMKKSAWPPACSTGHLSQRIMSFFGQRMRWLAS